MNTFYRPGLVEMFLHGVFGRHSWFMERMLDPRGQVFSWSYKCRICQIDQPEMKIPELWNELP